MKIKLRKEQRIRINQPRDIFPIMKNILKREGRIGQNREHFWVIGLTQDDHVLFVELLNLGHFDRYAIESSDVFQIAIAKGAERIIIVRNDPSNHLDVLEADRDMFEHLVVAGELIGKTVADYLIFCETDYYSFQVASTVAIN